MWMYCKEWNRYCHFIEYFKLTCELESILSCSESYHASCWCIAPSVSKKLTQATKSTNYFHRQDPMAKDMLINVFGLESFRKSYYHTVYYTQPASTVNKL